MIKRIFTSFLIIFLLMSSMTPSFAQQIEYESHEEYELYRLIEEVNIDNILILPKDSYIFGYQDKEEFKFSFNGEIISIEASKLNKADNLELIEERELIEQLNNLTPSVEELPSNTILYNQHTEIEVQEKSNFDIYQYYDTSYVLIGGIPYQLKQPVDNRDSAGKIPQEELDKSINSGESNNDQTDVEKSKNQSDETESSVESDKGETLTEEEVTSKTHQKENASEVDDNTKKQTANKATINRTTMLMRAVDVWSQSNADYFKVNVYSLPVYINENGSLIKQAELREGQVYKINGSLSNWHVIDFGGKKAYVWKHSTSPYTGSLPKSFTTSTNYGNKTIITVNNAVVNDNTSGTLIPFGMLVKNIEYPVLGKVGNWYKVIYANRIGYIHKNGVRENFTSADKYFQVTVHSLPIYESKNGKLTKVGELRKDEVYKRTGIAGNWHAIQFGNKKGYVWSKDTIPAKKNDMKTEVTKTNPKGTFTTKQHTVVYDNTSGQMVPIGQISEDNNYPYELIVGNWVKVSFGNRYGYVYKEWIDFNFSSNQNYFRVTDDYLPVYHNIGGSLERVGHLVVNQVYKRTGSKGNWHEIQFGNRTGYVWSKSTEPSSRAAARNWNTNLSNSSKQLLANNGLKVYDNTSGMVLFARIQEGTKVPVVDKLGNWYRILIGNRIGFIHQSGVSQHVYNYTNYNVSLNEVITRQLGYNPQTDDHTYAYVHKDYITKSGNTGTVKATSLHVRDIPNGNSYGTIPSGTKVTIIGTSSMNSDWYKIRNPFSNYREWMKADRDQLNYYMNPNNFVNDSVQRLQFLRLDIFTNTSTANLGKLLRNKGVLSGKESVYYKAARDASINEVYLVAHSLLETGNGTSDLAKGVPVVIERDKNGHPIKDSKGNTKIRLATTKEKPDSVVYNVYGIGAYDGCAVRCGAEYAFNKGWTTIDKAILGGANFISEDFIQSPVYKQNTLYKMKWNPGFFGGVNPGPHQYASDVGWAYKQVNRISSIFNLLDSYSMILDIPKYR